jgi:hypothetical protein
VFQKLKDLKLAYKVGLLPATAGLAFAVIFLVSLTLGLRSADRLDQIQNGSVPSLEISRDMENLLAELQRTMQDAVAAADPFMLEETEALRSDFQARVEAGRQTVTADSAALNQVAADFDAYYETAYSATSRMISVETGDAVIAALQEMTA